MAPAPRHRALVLALPLLAALALPGVAATSAHAAKSAPCTKKAIAKALSPDVTVESKVCAKGWAGGAAGNKDFDFEYLVKSKMTKSGGYKWVEANKEKFCGKKKDKLPKKVYRAACRAS